MSNITLISSYSSAHSDVLCLPSRKITEPIDHLSSPRSPPFTSSSSSSLSSSPTSSSSPYVNMILHQSQMEPNTFGPVNFEFRCHLAEGSPMGSVSNFSSMVELYDKIGQCFDISPKEIMYCTLNTSKVDMDRILGGQIGLDDIIYVHRKGIRKQVEVTKTEKFLGLTIADNSNGCSYIKKVKLDSTASRVPFIKVGDHIESIMEQSMVGCRHYEVARYLKLIPLDKIFTLTLIEPVSSTASSLSQDEMTAKSLEDNRIIRNGFGTLRLRNNGQLASLLNDDASSSTMYANLDGNGNGNDDSSLMLIALSYINKQLEKFIGINDDELAEELWHLAVQTNPHQFATSISRSDLNEFKFNSDVLFNVWTIVNDVVHGRMPTNV